MFQDYLRENTELLEKLITFGGKAYPKFGQVVILAGGAGSGKGFQIENLLGIEGKKFDVDELKKLAIKSDKFAKRIKDETGYELSKFNLRNPDNVGKVHEILSDVYGLPDKNQQATFASILTADPERKPNLIFDVTLKGMRKLETISRNVRELGYAPENVHIVWVVNNIDVAIKQNKERSRVVPDEILMDTHEGVALTMRKILGMGDKITKYMNGDIWLTFNRFKLEDVENNPERNDTGMKTSKFGGSYIDKADYVRVKKQGGTQIPPDKLEQRIYDKIKKYVPDTKTW